MPVAAISTTGLRKTYRDGQVVAVDGLDLEVRTGEIFGLLGPNGAGKTTTIGMLTTSVVPTGGSARIGGVDVIGEPAVAKQLIGVVPQFNTLDRALDVGENLYFHGRYFGMSRAEARTARDESLKRFNLADRATMPVMALSGGMAQRLMVARATLHRPAVLFLDEPTSGLDPQSRLALWDVVRGLQADGQTVLLTTHYMEEADQLCDRVAIMDNGRIVALDTPAGLKRSVADGTVVRVHVADDGLGGTTDERLARAGAALQERLPDAGTPTVIDNAVQLTMTGEGILPRVMSAAEEAGLTVTDLSAAEPTLETVFIALTGRTLREGPPQGPPPGMGKPR